MCIFVNFFPSVSVSSSTTQQDNAVEHVDVVGIESDEHISVSGRYEDVDIMNVDSGDDDPGYHWS